MRLGSRQAFLVLRKEPASDDPSVVLLPSLPAALSGWTAGTRLSPVWGFADFGCGRPGRLDFDGQHILLFVGPVRPAALWTGVDLAGRPGGLNVWATVGAFNLVLRVDADKDGLGLVERVEAWAGTQRVPHERWRVEDGVVVDTAVATLGLARDQALYDRLATLAGAELDPSLTLQVQEFYALMASALARSANVSSSLHQTLRRTFDGMAAIIERCHGNDSRDSRDILDTYARLAVMNAALSRFSSQAFSGISPIVSTECHFWTHSLLGTGSANLALARLVGFIEETLGSARLPERVLALVGQREGIPDYESLLTNDDFLWTDHIGKAKLAGAEDEPVMPLVTYFSGRDGYSSQLQTLSAPLSSIAQANSHSTNIMTVTHELSHIFVEGILGYLYPDPGDEEAIRALTEIMSSTSRAPQSTMFAAAQRLLGEALVCMEQTATGRPVPQSSINPRYVDSLVAKWRREVKEIIVHTFDYLYFFGDEPEAYARGIWSTWCAIPGIGERIPDYVLRTLCAISPRFLKKDAEPRRLAARNALLSALRPLAEDQTITANYAAEAIRQVEANWGHQDSTKALAAAYDARLYLVRFVTAFLHSDTVAARLFSEPRIVGGTATGYAKQRGIYDDHPIENPLRFTREHLQRSPTEGDSVWLLHNVAFCCPPRGPR